MWIKVCGITDPENAAAVASCGVDAIGLNFFPGSKRFVADRASEVRGEIPQSVAAIGLFVNASVAAMRLAIETYALDAIQLHGDEPASVVEDLSPCPVYRAIRVSNGQIGATIERAVQELVSPQNLAGILIDAASLKGLGGTGEAIDWMELRDSMQPHWPRLVLAGGLSPANVANAIKVVAPWGVDVASGVEQRPGVKDKQLVEKFVAAARG